MRELAEDLVEVDGLRVDVELAGEEADGLGQAADRIDIEALDDSGFCGIGGRHEQAVATFGGGREGHREHTLDRPRLAGQSQLADDREVARPIERRSARCQQQAQRDRQVEAAGVFLEVGGGEVDDNAVDRARDIPS